MIKIQKVSLNSAISHDISISMVRADLLHPLASGNKIFKLLPNLQFAKDNSYSEILSFGGAFSNHIHALALMTQKHGLKSIGIIRGEKEYATNPTLQDAQNAGMKLVFVSRKDYKRRNETEYLSELQLQYPNTLILPEGGSSQLAINGCSQLAKEIDKQVIGDILAVPCGTGATFAGLICGSSFKQIYGYAVLTDDSLSNRIEDFIKKEHCTKSNYKIVAADYGGYAKLNSELLDFIFDWLEQTGILLDPIYTSKMCMRIMQQIEAGEFQAATKITMIHSGGLQGWRGMKKCVIQLAGEDKWNKVLSHL